MKREGAHIDRDPEVRLIAKTLGISGPDLKAQLCDVAVDKVARRMAALDIRPETLDDVHAVVLDMTGVRVKRVDNDSDLKRLSAEYRKTHPVVPVQLELEFGAKTEALVFREACGDARAPTFTAIVDARGGRRWRAWFAERHEPAHLLVPDPSGRVAWRRTTADRPEPVEQVIDAIASRIGFWEPIVGPAIVAALRRESSVLAAFDSVRQELAPEASQEASYRAFARLARFPLSLVRTDIGCRRSDRGNVQGSLALRAVTTIWNVHAERAGMVVWENFRIPAHSVLHEARDAFIETTLVQDDDLNAWRTESGHALARRALAVRVTARGPWATIEACG